MTIRRKLFLAMASFIIAMSVIFVLVTQLVVKASLEHVKVADRSNEISALNQLFIDYYEQNGKSWDNVQQALIEGKYEENRPNISLLLLSLEGIQLYSSGKADYEAITRLGIKSSMLYEGESIALLYYHDPEVANLSTIQIGIGSSVSVLLLISSFMFVVISLLIAYWLSKRLTRPIRLLIPAIERLGKGELGTQAPVTSKDEYATVAQAFNVMSDQLQRSEEIRRNLVADVSHELRTPITILRGKLDLIQQNGHSVDPETLLPLQDELIRLTRLVDDLHQLSLAEAKKLVLEKSLVDISTLLGRVIDWIIEDANAKQIQLIVDKKTESLMINIDPNRMTQVFMNIIVNAVRYTPPNGSVKMTIEDELTQLGSLEKIRITIADTGLGIESKQLPFIFNRFYRTDEARARNSGGMGLGLAIAKEFVLAHNGTIEVDSNSNNGTSFIIKLPR
ncbi:HAMP domain-containing protein [Paenibacillus sp. GSMTC-2017]|uniref:sensor histidine kinase n=1 Tax=Paenibacillus sp. GSMTC-2017 TaxID=2794350 RepID=UPI0018D89C6D|nr:ATP-binding protein [Paenibacillus sp. GSMTC-2017]MBH5320901.1 HAMP domain-containing protein [Paenibacillus sp. GSMTC-2017]